MKAIARAINRLLWVDRDGAAWADLRAAQWQRWCDAVDAQGANPSIASTSLHREIGMALRPELLRAAVLIGLHAASSFIAAMQIHSFLDALLDTKLDTGALALSAFASVLFTVIAWISLNHVFYAAEVVGIGARSYAERRLQAAVDREPTLAQGRSLASVLDREGGRIEECWCGIVTLALVAATLAYISIFFFVALGSGAIAALITIGVSSMVLARLAAAMSTELQRVSAASLSRAESGAYAVGNRVAIALNGWSDSTATEYARKRGIEEAALKRVARLIAMVSALSSFTPIAALLSSALLQSWLHAGLETSGMLSAIALIGGLRSVANNVPDAIHNLTQGRVAHETMSALMRFDGPVPLAAPLFPAGTPHVAITGGSASDRTRFLLRAAQNCSHEQVFLATSQPWIFTGTVRENLSMDSAVHADEALRAAMSTTRLSPAYGGELIDLGHSLQGTGEGLSRGQARRLELARAVLSPATAIFLDQPTTGLDPHTADGLLRDLLQGPWRDLSVVYVSHDPRELELANESWRLDPDGGLSIERHVPNEVALTSVSTDASARLGATEASRSIDSARRNPPIGSTGDSVLLKLTRFGFHRGWWLALLLLLLREILAVSGDYALSTSSWQHRAALDSLLIASIALAAALTSMGSALLTVSRLLARSTQICLAYLQSLLTPSQQAGDSQEDGPIGRITRDQRRIDEVLPSLLLEAFGAVALLVVTTAYVALTAPAIALALCPLLAYFHYLNRCALPALAAASASEITASARLLQNVQELAEGACRLAVGRRRHGAVQWLQRASRERAFASMNTIQTQRWFNIRIDLIGVATFSCVVAGMAVSRSFSPASPGAGLAVSLSYSVIAIFSRASRTFLKLRQALDSADRLIIEAGTRTMSTPRFVNDALVRFEQVSFGHTATSAPLLHEFDLTLRAGVRVAITGPSGSGKSTLASLILGTLHPTQGTLHVLGSHRPYVTGNCIPGELQWLSAEPLFRPGPLLAHFGLGADQVAVLLAAAAALGVTDLLSSLPNGVFHVVADDGHLPLGRGERQALAHARLLTSPPRIAVLDESTSELTGDHELHLLETLCKRLPATLMLLISHNAALANQFPTQLQFTAGRPITILRRHAAPAFTDSTCQ